MKEGFVYIVTHESALWRAAHPVIKIGKAVDIDKRICDLNTCSPINLILVASIQSKDPHSLEHYLHKMFSRNRLNGEWFDLTPSMIVALRSYYLSGDRFDELFDFGLSAEQIEIRDLKSHIIELNKQHAADQKTIRGLEEELKLYLPIQTPTISENAKSVKLRNYTKFVKHG